MSDKPWLIAAALLIAAGLSACGSASQNDHAYDVADETRVSIEQGDLTGVRNLENKSRAWLGIPFASPPVGDLRWRAPRPAMPFGAPLIADTPDHACLQINLPSILPGKAGDLVGSEDCLYLNIWAPETASNEPLPVMVWVHGGGNATGYAGQYDYSQLTAQEDVIVVALNYRLGPMGWFSHEALRDTAETELDESMNFGLLDLMQGLEWVQTNIAAFGGDPDKVTIFGESAGGFNISALMMAPQSEGLFDAAIIQSAGFNTYTLKEAEHGPSNEDDRRGYSSGEAISQLQKDGSLPETAGTDSEAFSATLRSLDPEALYDAYLALLDPETGGDQINSIDNTADGVLIPIRQTDAEGHDPRITSRDIPLLIGTNRDETRVFAMENEAFTKKKMGVLFRPIDKDAYIASGEHPSRLWASLGVQQIADRRAEELGSPTFTYRFDWDEQGSFMFSDISLLIGAVHALDVNFVSGDFRLPFLDDKAFFKEETAESRRVLSSRMMAYWASFARDFDPDVDSQPDWPAWSEGQKTLILDSEADGGLRTQVIRETPQDIAEAFISDPRFINDAQRCEIAGVMKMIAASQSAPTDPFTALSERYCTS